MKTMEEILHYENLMRVIIAQKDGVPGGILDNRHFTQTDRCDGNAGSYIKVTSTRKVAKACMYGAASKNTKLPGISKVPVTCIHSFEHFGHSPMTVAKLKSENEQTQLWGAQIIGKNAAEAARRFVNLRRAAWYSALTIGKIYLDAEGELTLKAADAAITIDFGIPATNKSQLNALGKGNIIAASWDADTTDIPGHLHRIQKAAAALCGYPITTAYYGENVPTYVAKNAAMKEFLKMSPGYAPKVAEGLIPDGFLQLKWRPAFTANFDKGGVTKWFWGPDQIVFTPDVADLGWWGFIEGSFPLPTDSLVSGDGGAALSSMLTTFGMGAYAEVKLDPPSIVQYSFDTFLPVIAVPKAVFIATVKF